MFLFLHRIGNGRVTAVTAAANGRAALEATANDRDTDRHAWHSRRRAKRTASGRDAGLLVARVKGHAKIF
jgi:hypothetical protein